MGCCGKATPKRPAPVAGAAAARAAAVAATPADKLVQVVYRGARRGDFVVRGGVTRTNYRIPGQGQLVVQVATGRPGINPADLAWFRAVGQGREFGVVEAPKPAPELAPVQAPAVMAKADSAAWQPATMDPGLMHESRVEGATDGENDSGEAETKPSRKPRRKATETGSAG